MVNTVLLEEAAGKGHAVHRVVMRRQGHCVVGHTVLKRSELREMLQDEVAVRGMINQIMITGRTVRSTPMQWAYESKKLRGAVQFLSWRPPWVLPAEGRPVLGPGLRWRTGALAPA